MSHSDAQSKLDPATAAAANPDLTPQQKIDGFKELAKAVGNSAMLTTHGSDGELHSRAMTPVSVDGLKFVFLANNASHKFNELKNDSHVNISYYDKATTGWASVAGTATISQDRELIKKHWSSFLSGYFGNLNDGVHKGDESDPRVTAIIVTPSEIRYYVADSKFKVVQQAEVALNAAMGKATAPGELRVITRQEIQLVEGLHKQ